MELNDYDKILEVCRKNEGKNIDLWIKALKFFCNSKEGNLEKYLQLILDDIYKLEALSP